MTGLLLLTVVVLLLAVSAQGTDVAPFSGVYTPSLRFQPDDAAGAFLVKSPRFMSTMQYVMNLTTYQTRSHFDEATIDVILRGHCATCLNLQTRDFLDYFVENLSTTVENLSTDQRDLLNYLSRGLKKTISTLKAAAEAVSSADRRQDQTMAVLVFNSDMTRKVSTRIKVLFFQATFWSVYRYYKNVRIMVKSNADLETVMDMQLAQKEVVNLDISLPSDKTQDLKYSATVSLMQGTLIKQSLDRVAQSWQLDDHWSSFKYMYFSVGDQLLHARRFADLYDALDVGTEGNFLLAPHRMQTLPLAQGVPPRVRAMFWPANDSSSSVLERAASTGGLRRDAFDSSMFSDRALKALQRTSAKPPAQQWVAGASVSTEDLLAVQGSCCDNGRILFPDCATSVKANQPSQSLNIVDDNMRTAKLGGRDSPGRSQVRYKTRQSRPQWAGCTEWGARNFSNWLRVGPDGFSMPPVTVHLAHCMYSASRQLCPIPPSAAATSYGTGQCTRLPVPMHVNEGPASAFEGGRGRKMAEKTYLHCSEVGTVRWDPQTEHLLGRSERQMLRALDLKGK